MQVGIYPGSFDPLTNGHLDIINRAAAVYGKLYVAVARNQAKRSIFTVDERLKMLSLCCSNDIKNVEIVAFDGLLVEYCRKNNIHSIVRGLRAIADYEYEYAIALMNKRLAPEIETIFMMASADYSFISSRIVKEVASYGGDISSLVPSCIKPYLEKKFT